MDIGVIEKTFYRRSWIGSSRTFRGRRPSYPPKRLEGGRADSVVMSKERLITSALKPLFILPLLSLLPTTPLCHAAPKKVLVVTVTLGFRHSSIPTFQKVLRQFSEQGRGSSAGQSGAFTVDFVEQPPGKPEPPRAPKPLPETATDAEKEVFQRAQQEHATAMTEYKEANAPWQEKVKEALKVLGPESLKNYDAVIFANTTGDLPLPDRDGFLNWIRSGHAFIGFHSASDTLHSWPGYREMLGGEFAGHGPQIPVTALSQSSEHPATRMLKPAWEITQEEIYQFKNYTPEAVQELLVLDRRPDPKNPESGRFAVSWCRSYGEGRVFYTSLGHREDMIDDDPNLKDRKNPLEVTQACRAHLLGGILWALRLDEGR